MSVRAVLRDKFAEDWADIEDLKNVYVVASQGRVSVDSVVTAIVSQQTIAPSPAAPMSKCDVGQTIELVSPIKDLDDGLDELDLIVPTLLAYLRQHVNAKTPVATAFAYSDNQSGYQIPITVVTDIQE